MQNGLATFATWTTIASCLNLATFLIYDLDFDSVQCNRNVIIWIASLSLIYFLLENFVWQKYLLYIFTPWLVLTFGLSGSLIKRLGKQMDLTTTKLIASVLCLVVVFAFGKLFLIWMYLTRCPHYIDKRQSHILLQIKEEETTRKRSTK